jgi:hypothetical protein
MKERKAAAMQLVSDVVQATPELQGMPKNKYNQAGNQIAQRVAGGEAVDPVDVVRTVLGVERVAPAAPVAAPITPVATPTAPVAAPTPQFDITPIQVAPTRAERVAAAKPIINDIIDANYGDVMVPGKVTNQIATQMAQRAARKEVFNPTEIVQSVLTERGLVPEVAVPEVAAPEVAAPGTSRTTIDIPSEAAGWRHNKLIAGSRSSEVLNTRKGQCNSTNPHRSCISTIQCPLSRNSRPCNGVSCCATGNRWYR